MKIAVAGTGYVGLSMPNTVIEAQVSGLPCVISDTITSECNVSGLVQFISHQAPKERWAE